MDKTLAELLGPYSATKLVREMSAKGVSVSRATVYRWMDGKAPDARFLPALAEVIRVDLADLTRIVAAVAAAA